MIGAIIETVIIVIGLAATVILFYHLPGLAMESEPPEVLPTISVIIPARNEEQNLGLLLSDLQKQAMNPYEIIVVDDASEDDTAAIARAHGVRLVSIKHKPEDWTGKTWACQCGAEAARGDLLLFLDADVRLSVNGLRKLVSAYAKHRSTISIQPYHRTVKPYEQCSLIFNLVQIAANGSALPWHSPEGLFGPVILISQEDYTTLGGHKAVKTSIVEDMSLGLQLNRLGLAYHVFIGDHDISFRMYSGGLRYLLEGWSKNLAAGAAKTPLPVFLLVFLWISSMMSVPYHIIAALAAADWFWVCLCGAVYIIWVMVLRKLSRQIGHFSLWSSIAYPLPLLVFLGVFLLSSFKKIFRLKVRWKGRAIATETKKCD
jgi:4,4'-diaponeurosporenoate glycosyltransferase